MEHKETAKSMEKTSQYLSETILAVIDKLAGKKSNLKLSFEDLTLDTGMMKTKLNGSIVLDIVYSKDAE
jgi:hypothetical protein